MTKMWEVESRGQCLQIEAGGGQKKQTNKQTISYQGCNTSLNTTRGDTMKIFMRWTITLIIGIMMKSNSTQ